jgi:hypothetical protein
MVTRALDIVAAIVVPMRVFGPMLSQAIKNPTYRQANTGCS